MTHRHPQSSVPASLQDGRHRAGPHQGEAPFWGARPKGGWGGKAFPRQRGSSASPVAPSAAAQQLARAWSCCGAWEDEQLKLQTWAPALGKEEKRDPAPEQTWPGERLQWERVGGWQHRTPIRSGRERGGSRDTQGHSKATQRGRRGSASPTQPPWDRDTAAPSAPNTAAPTAPDEPSG